MLLHNTFYTIGKTILQMFNEVGLVLLKIVKWLIRNINVSFIFVLIIICHRKKFDK